jgi:Nif-specific regulatory protein
MQNDPTHGPLPKPKREKRPHNPDFDHRNRTNPRKGAGGSFAHLVTHNVVLDGRRPRRLSALVVYPGGRAPRRTDDLDRLGAVREAEIDARLRLERDLYRQCLDLSRTEDPAPLLEQTVGLLRELVRAERGYIELAEVARAQERRWSADVGIDDDERELIRDRISRGVVAEAIATGQTVLTPSAALDVRFAKRESVRGSHIEAVLCVPLAADGIAGVVYLQNRLDRGAFDDNDVRCAETVSQYVSSLAGRLLELLRRRDLDDATIAVRSKLRAHAVIGRSRALAAFLDRVSVVASMEANVLLTGASGTGKSMFARVLHDNSRRAQGPFVELNCAALPQALAESELFGAERGAHSGVTQRATDGKVAAAAGGTLFLDEIGELDPSVQAKLLLFLQSKQYFRLGGTTPRTVDTRVIAATNRDLEAAMADGSFREDLYYRVRGVHLPVPPLAQRREDIGPVATHLVETICASEGLPPMTLSRSAIAAMEVADWPGNIRELKNACWEATINARLDDSTTIEVEHVFPRNVEAIEGPETFHAACQRLERSFLATELTKRDWNVALTARELDMSRSHLNVLIRRYDLRREAG